MNGFIKLNRDFTLWQWYRHPAAKGLYLHLLLKAGFKETKWQGMDIKEGQVITSLSHLADETGYSVHQVRAAIKKLEATGEITYSGTHKYSILTVEGWGKHQRDKSFFAQTGHSDDTPTTHNGQHIKKEKKDKKEKNLYIVPTLSEIKDYCKSRGNTIDPVYFFDYYQSIGWKRGSVNIKDWKACVRTWERNGLSKSTTGSKAVTEHEQLQQFKGLGGKTI